MHITSRPMHQNLVDSMPDAERSRSTPASTADAISADLAAGSLGGFAAAATPDLTPLPATPNLTPLPALRFPRTPTCGPTKPDTLWCAWRARPRMLLSTALKFLFSKRSAVKKSSLWSTPSSAHASMNCPMFSRMRALRLLSDMASRSSARATLATSPGRTAFAASHNTSPERRSGCSGPAGSGASSKHSSHRRTWASGSTSFGTTSQRRTTSSNSLPSRTSVAQ
mmetsp:Transcript_19233/g.49220  ORF Transcript_19233/g.49220 Transcript_19233/m.49220 type:complete len:225 (-) Transcript_19233:94-768(-)